MINYNIWFHAKKYKKIMSQYSILNQNVIFLLTFYVSKSEIWSENMFSRRGSLTKSFEGKKMLSYSSMYMYVDDSQQMTRECFWNFICFVHLTPFTVFKLEAFYFTWYLYKYQRCGYYQEFYCLQFFAGCHMCCKDTANVWVSNHWLHLRG